MAEWIERWPLSAKRMGSIGREFKPRPGRRRSFIYIYMNVCVCIMTPKSDVHIEVRWSALKCDGLQFVSPMLSEYVLAHCNVVPESAAIFKINNQKLTVIVGEGFSSSYFFFYLYLILKPSGVAHILILKPLE